MVKWWTVLCFAVVFKWQQTLWSFGFSNKAQPNNSCVKQWDNCRKTHADSRKKSCFLSWIEKVWKEHKIYNIYIYIYISHQFSRSYFSLKFTNFPGSSTQGYTHGSQCVQQTHPVCFHVLAAQCCRFRSLWTRTSHPLTRRFLQPRSPPATGPSTPPHTVLCLKERERWEKVKIGWHSKTEKGIFRYMVLKTETTACIFKLEECFREFSHYFMTSFTQQPKELRVGFVWQTSVSFRTNSTKPNFSDSKHKMYKLYCNCGTKQDPEACDLHTFIWALKLKFVRVAMTTRKTYQQ